MQYFRSSLFNKNFQYSLNHHNCPEQVTITFSILQVRKSLIICSRLHDLSLSTNIDWLPDIFLGLSKWKIFLLCFQNCCFSLSVLRELNIKNLSTTLYVFKKKYTYPCLETFILHPVMLVQGPSVLHYSQRLPDLKYRKNLWEKKNGLSIQALSISVCFVLLAMFKEKSEAKHCNSIYNKGESILKSDHSRKHTVWKVS